MKKVDLNMAEIYINAVYNDLCSYENNPENFNPECWRDMRECLQMGIEHIEKLRGEL